MSEPMMVYEFSNVTYYHDDDLKYLFERTMAVARGLTPGSGKDITHCCLLPVGSIAVRFASDNAIRARASREAMVTAPGKYKVIVYLARKAYMFNSELEAMSGLTEKEPILPDETIHQLCFVFGRACCDATFTGSVSTTYLHEFGTYKEYPGDEQAFAALHITPLCRVRINKRVKPGAQEEAKIQAAKELVARTSERLTQIRNSRMSWQRMLESALEVEEEAKVIHAAAVTNLRRLEEGSDE